MDRRLDVWTDGWVMDKWIDEWTDGWLMDKWMDGWMDGWMNRRVYFSNIVQHVTCHSNIEQYPGVVQINHTCKHHN